MDTTSISYEEIIEKLKELDNDVFVRTLEAINSYNGCLGDLECFEMDFLDDIIGTKKPTEILEQIDLKNFSLNDNYFTFGSYGNVFSLNDKFNYYLNNYGHWEDIIDDLIEEFYNIMDCLDKEVKEIIANHLDEEE